MCLVSAASADPGPSAGPWAAEDLTHVGERWGSDHVTTALARDLSGPRENPTATVELAIRVHRRIGAILEARVWRTHGVDRGRTRNGPARCSRGPSRGLSGRAGRRAAAGGTASPAGGQNGGLVTTALSEVARVGNCILDQVEPPSSASANRSRWCWRPSWPGGHVLLEDFPGLGKTLAARSLRAGPRAWTSPGPSSPPTCCPADLTGSFVYDQRSGEFEFRQGPLFTGLLLADEINRTPPKTQAALLEAMQERQVTVEGQTFPLPAARSTSSRPPTRSSTRAPTRCPRPSSTASSLRVAFGYPDRRARSGTCCSGRLERRARRP